MTAEHANEYRFGALAAIVAGALWLANTGATSAAARLDIMLPLKRTVYQTNERIDLALVRSSTNAPLPAADLSLTVTGDNGAKLTFTFPMKAVAQDVKARPGPQNL